MITDRQLRKTWTEVHFLRPDIRYKSKTRRAITGWLKSQKLMDREDWVYAGFRGFDGLGKRHIFRFRDPAHAMLAKLTFG